jgi:uracil-DNA glycosylase family 4
MADTLKRISLDVITCERCPRLRQYCLQVAREKRRMYRDHQYWGKPVPGFGDPKAKLLVIGLAPAAHGGNRTGRVFTGDRSGDWLYAALHAYGFANQPISEHRNDGLKLIEAYVTAAARCAPPQNKPTLAEFANCRPYLVRELKLLRRLRVILCLGKLALDNYWLARSEQELEFPRPRFGFAHGAEWRSPEGLAVLCSYHPSQQNTQTGRLNRSMFHAVFARAQDLCILR